MLHPASPKQLAAGEKNQVIRLPLGHPSSVPRISAQADILALSQQQTRHWNAMFTGTQSATGAWIRLRSHAMGRLARSS